MEILGASMIAMFVIGMVALIMHDCGIKQGAIMVFQAVCGVIWMYVASAMATGVIKP